MKKFRATLIFAAGIAGYLLTFQQAVHGHPSILNNHLDPEMTGVEYRALFEKLGSGSRLHSLQADPLRDILNVGKRNLDWIDLINENRPTEQKLQLSTPENQIAYPITAPKVSNRALVLEELKQFKANCPEQLKTVWFSNSALTNSVPVSDDEFLEYSRKLDRIYQSASRWLLQEDELPAYASFSRNDVRGYFALVHTVDLDAKLSQIEHQPYEEKQSMVASLVGLCKNGGKSFSSCSNELNREIQTKHSALAFKNKYWRRGEQTYNAYFTLSKKRSDIVWNQNEQNTMWVPFIDPAHGQVQSWLAENIEDEWKLNDWHLKLRFLPQSSWNAFSTARIEFEAGATPHVNELGGNVIVMDANRNIQEYTTRWTIRHEFGHVLGLPDCYVEFYDSENKVMVNYQIDTEDLMCSRRGHLKQRHFDALRSAYFRTN